jgi:signal transduction histidine kinase
MGRHRVTELADAAWQAVEPELRSHGGALVVEPAENGERAPFLYCDGERMIMALRNIFENALHARPDATVRVDAERVHPDRVNGERVDAEGAGSAGYRSAGGSQKPADRTAAILRITDNGPGVAPEDLPRLFERFYRSPANRAPGSGLGLSIVEGVAKLHGGTVSAYNVGAARGATGLGIELMIPEPAQESGRPAIPPVGP